MRKFAFLFIALLVMLTPISAVSAESRQGDNWLDPAMLSQGIAAVTYEAKPKIKTKVMITKGKESYTYNLTPGALTEQFPLQLGNGEYKVMILENVSGKSYKVMKQETVRLNLKDDKIVFLNSIQNINWTSTSKAAAKASELADGLKTNAEIVQAVYDFVTSTIAYDDKLAKSAPVDYLPSVDRTLAAKKDICYGYSALFAAMLRSLDIPTKLVMGYSEYTDVYHAWNEVYVKGKWMTIDTTIDAGLKKGDKPVEMYKDATKYTMTKQY